MRLPCTSPQPEQFWVKKLESSGLSYGARQHFSVVLDQDLTFYTATANESGAHNGGDYSVNDRVWVVKARFSRVKNPAINAK